MVIPNRNLIFYSCVAKGATIVAEFNSKYADLGAFAAKCLEITPPLHSVFSHTTRHKTYIFLIDSCFVYFGIFDEKLHKSQGLYFLNCVKTSFDQIFAHNRLDIFDPLCFQGQLNPVFHQLLALPSNSHSTVSGELDSPRGQIIRSNSSCEVRSMRLKKTNKKKALISESKENNLDISDDEEGGDDLRREFSLPNNKNGSFAGDGGQHKAKRIWKKQVWVVLSLDLIVCSILFVMWLWICRGFKCIDS